MYRIEFEFRLPPPPKSTQRGLKRLHPEAARLERMAEGVYSNRGTSFRRQDKPQNITYILLPQKSQQHRYQLQLRAQHRPENRPLPLLTS